MPCSDSSSSFVLFLDKEDKFIKFEYAKITCGQEIKADRNFQNNLKGYSLEDILKKTFLEIQENLNLKDEESLFIVYSEWELLRISIINFLGQDYEENMDEDRCQIISIERIEEGTEIALLVLPPKEFPKIISCGIKQQQEERMKNGE